MKLIILRNPTEEMTDIIVSQTTCISNGNDLVIPYDCLNEVQQLGIPTYLIEFTDCTNMYFEIIEY